MIVMMCLYMMHPYWRPGCENMGRTVNQRRPHGHPLSLTVVNPLKMEQ